MNHLAATINNPVLGPQLQALNGITFTQKLVPALILMGLSVGVVFFFFNMLMGGLMWINAGGDKGQTEAARSKITNAVIGVIVLFSLWAILSLVGEFLGTDLTLFNLSDLRIK